MMSHFCIISNRTLGMTYISSYVRCRDNWFASLPFCALDICIEHNDSFPPTITDLLSPFRVTCLSFPFLLCGDVRPFHRRVFGISRCDVHFSFPLLGESFHFRVSFLVLKDILKRFLDAKALYSKTLLHVFSKSIPTSQQQLDD